MSYLGEEFEDEEPKDSKYKVVTNPRVIIKWAAQKEWKEETGMILWTKKNNALLSEKQW